MPYQQDGDGQWWYRSPTTHCRVPTFQCAKCGKEFPRLKQLAKVGKPLFCSRPCANEATAERHRATRRGAGNPAWRGGRVKNQSGYVLVYAPDHPAAQGRRHPQLLEHHLVMEQHLGRRLLADERVHHKNGIRDDNRIENLELWSISHPAGQRVADLVAWAHDILARYDS